MTPREQEALSKKYSGGIIMLHLLSDGSFAIFDQARRLIAIDPAPTLSQLAEWSRVGEAAYDTARALEQRQHQTLTRVRAEDLGL